MRDMLGRQEAVSVQEALSRLMNSLGGPLPVETASLDEALGRVLAGDITAPEDLPGFARSTMDGFSVIAADTFGAGEGSPAYLEVRYDIPMGAVPGFTLKRGEAARIATGGMLPDGADAVLMLEYAQDAGDGMIEAQKSLAPGDNVVQRGEDVRAGEPLLMRGRRLRPQDVAVLAGTGITLLGVFPSPVVSIISTGDEIVAASEPCGTGQVRDMNSHNLAGLVHEDHGTARRLGIFKDQFESIKSVVEKSLSDSDLVLITGGSSVGARDMTERVIRDLGTVLFHSVTLKPGKPLLAGAADGKLMFGLPGHPRAVSVCYELFVRPVLRKLSGEEPRPFEKRKNVLRALMSKRVHSSPGRQENINVSLEERDGRLWAVPLLGKSSLMTTLVQADGTVTIPLEKLGLEQEEEVDVNLL
jgi:molybdopterin molybdotransferase